MQLTETSLGEQRRNKNLQDNSSTYLVEMKTGEVLRDCKNWRTVENTFYYKKIKKCVIIV